jgi:hypothetical protein
LRHAPNGTFDPWICDIRAILKSADWLYCGHQVEKKRDRLTMANPKELLEAAEAILTLRRLPAVQRHQELDGPLRQAEEWARTQYLKVSEQNAGGKARESRKTASPGKRRRN